MQQPRPARGAAAVRGARPCDDFAFGAMARMVLAAIVGVVVLLFCAKHYLGLAPHDVLLVGAVGMYALFERWRGRGGGGDGAEEGLLGEDAMDGVQIRWNDFVCEHHQLLGCIVRGKRHNRRGRSERILSLAVSTLALLYWKAIFRPPRVSMHSLQGLRSSLWTLLVSKSVQQLMKQAIRFFAGRTAAWQQGAGWLDALQLQWQILQYWTLGFMMLCVFLALKEGMEWTSLLSAWLINMGFALVFFDLAFTYVKYKLLVAGIKARRKAQMGFRSR